MYLDPGFGGMLVQAIVAIAAVGGGLLFSLRKKISSLFSKDKDSNQSFNNKPTNTEEDDAVDVLDDEK